MRCTSPRTVGFLADGKTLCWSPRKSSKQFAPIQLPCGKCLDCRLENARQTAIRCVHEASMYENNSFITLTYSDENLKSERLNYADFQCFLKNLRAHRFDNLLDKIFPGLSREGQRQLWRGLPKTRRDSLYSEISIGVYTAGEYGERKKRPHWHSLIFNWRPDDLVPKYISDRGDQVYNSQLLTRLWPYGISELGQVTFESAGYCARYATKKLAHGPDGSHNFEPLSKRSTRSGIGKKWIEKYWPDVFNHGYLVLPGGQKTSIPRYYEKWFKKHHPDKWEHYIINVKSKIMESARLKEEKITLEEKKINSRRSGLKGIQIRRDRVRKRILEQKYEKLKQHTKL